MRWQLHKKFDESEPDPFYTFLDGGAGIAKSFLVNFITEYLKRTLEYPGGVSVMTVGIFYNYYCFYANASKGCCKLYELMELVHQSSDVGFVELLNWLHQNIGDAEHGDLEQIQAYSSYIYFMAHT